MLVGFISVLTDGFAPGKFHMYEVALIDRFVKSVQVPGQISLGAENIAETFAPAHGGTDGFSWARV